MLIWENESIIQRLEKADNLGRTASRARLLANENPFREIARACEDYIKKTI
jgi:hypothetical protein